MQYNNVNKNTLISKACEIKAARVGNGMLQYFVIAPDSNLQKAFLSGPIRIKLTDLKYSVSSEL